MSLLVVVGGIVGLATAYRFSHAATASLSIGEAIVDRLAPHLHGR